MRNLENMAHISNNQTERLVAINKLLPELENFLRKTLAAENLSENANTQREKFLSQLETLIKPPQLPPRGMKKLSTASAVNDEVSSHLPGKQVNDKPTANVQVEGHSNRDFISKQREISWRQKESDTSSIQHPTSAPYASQKKHQEDGRDQPVTEKPSVSSHSDETGIYERIRNESGSGYEKISNESGSGKYIDILNYEKQNNPPPVPERTHRTTPFVSTTNNDNGELQPNARYDVKSDILIQDLKNPTRTGPLKELRNNLKIWCVLKNKKLYIFKDLQHPASQVLDMTEYDVHIEDMTKLNFRLSKVGFPSLLLSVENEDDYKQWVNELEKCKYEELDGIVQESSRENKADDCIIEEAEEDDVRYERPMEVIAKFEKLNKDDITKQKMHHSNSEIVYEDMSGSGQNIELYENNQQTHSEPASIDNIANLTYDEELPPIPISSDEDHPKRIQKPDPVSVRHRELPALPSEDQISGSFESVSSTSDDDRSAALERKPRSSSGPPAYNVSNLANGSMDRKFSSSFLRQKEQSTFFNDPSAIFCGILHQRRVLAVWQKRYCKVKNESLLCYRNADNEDKPLLEVNLHGYKIALCDKETWRSHSFKMSQPKTETLYFAAETREQLMTWLKVLVREIDKEKFSGKDTLPRTGKKHLTPQPSGDTTSISSIEKKFGEDGSAFDADSESAATSSDDDANKPWQKENLTTSCLISEDPDAIIEGYLYKNELDRWILCRCMIKGDTFVIFKGTSTAEMEIQVPLEISKMKLSNSSAIDSPCFFVINLSWDQNELVLMVENREEWNSWTSALKKIVKSTIEEDDLVSNLLLLPKQNNNERKNVRSKKKKKLKNGSVLANQTTALDDRQQQEFVFDVRYSTSLEEQGLQKYCRVKNGLFTIFDDKEDFKVSFNLSSPNFKICHEKKQESNITIFTIRNSDQLPVFITVDSSDTSASLLKALWSQGANLIGEEDNVAKKVFKNIQEGKARKSFVDEQSSTFEYTFDERYQQPTERTVSDGEQNFIRPRKLTKKGKPRSGLDKGQERTPASNTKAGGSRMSAFFRSLPRRNRKKYDFAPDVTDGLPKSQLSGFVNEIRLDEKGKEVFTRRHTKVSGKIFYVYDIENDLKPIFKVPLRNAHIEDTADHENGRFSFEISSMESQNAFKFTVGTEEEFAKWFSALYLIDSKANQSGLSSRESLLDESKRNDADVETKQPFSGSNSSNSLSSILSKQAKSLAESEDEIKIAVSPRKISEEVFNGSHESVQYSGYLYEIMITEKNDVKSRTKIRRWCVLRKSWIEIYDNKNDKIPVRGISIGHHSLEVMSYDESGEKYAMCLRSEDEDYVLCANNDEEYKKWMTEFKKVLKKRGRRTSDTAKLALKSASGGIRQLLSSSSQSGSAKRDPKRETIVLNEDDKRVVEKFTDTVESGNKISGVLTVVMKDGKLTKPKKRLCTIRDGKFCIAKRSKPNKYISTIELLNVAILDECDLDKSLYRFRLDYGENKCMTFQTIDHETADNWMVGISMAILLERLTSRDKFPQQGEETGLDQNQDIEDVTENTLDTPAETNDLGLIDVSPVLIHNGRGSNSSNLSSDIKEEINRKISYGFNYLNPLSNLLESAFDETLSQYAGSTASSSREGTLERDRSSRISESARKNSDGVIIEEAVEDCDTVDGIPGSVSELANTKGNAETVHESSPNVFIKVSNYDSVTDSEILPATGSVSNTIAKFEQLGSSDINTIEDNVFQNVDYEPDNSQLEKQLAELLKERENLEKEQNVILDRIPDLQKVVREAKTRKLSESSSAQYKNEFEITKADLCNMQKRLDVVRKRLHIIENTIKNKASNISENFRTRGTVISPHVIV